MSRITDESPDEQARNERRGGATMVVVSLLFAGGTVLLLGQGGWLLFAGYILGAWAATGLAVGLRILLAARQHVWRR